MTIPAPPRAPDRSRRAFTMVEIVLALGILAILLSVFLNTYRGWVDRSRETTVRNQLDELKRTIETWQLTSQRPWFRPSPPPDFPADPWGQRFRVDPVRGLLWSLGPPDPERDMAPPPVPDQGLAMRYEPYPTDPPGIPRRLRSRPTASGDLELRWSWPGTHPKVLGFEILRAETETAVLPTAPGTPRRVQNRLGPFAPVATVPPEPPLEWVDTRVEAGNQYAYRVRALPGPGSPGGDPDPSPPHLATLPE